MSPFTPWGGTTKFIVSSCGSTLNQVSYKEIRDLLVRILQPFSAIDVHDHYRQGSLKWSETGSHVSGIVYSLPY